MSPQLSFQFTDSVTYSSETFVVHRGVIEVTDTILTLASEHRFGLVFISAEAGAGKTHLGAYCAGMLQSLGRKVHLLRGGEAGSWSLADLTRERSELGESILIDDAEVLLENNFHDGLFTALADRVLHAKGVLVLLSARPVEKLKVSQQIKSRLIAGLQLVMGLPEERQLDAIVKAMTKQRGLKLTPAKRSFILTRVPRTVAALTVCLNRLQQVASTSPAATSMRVLSEVVGEHAQG
jgi:chromosomal replication initiation ATPase DnaA